jgi:hypothetical protein
VWPGIIAFTCEVVRDKATPVTTPRAQVRPPKSDTCTDSLLALLSCCQGLVAPAFVALSVLSAPPSSSGSFKTDYLCSFMSIRGWQKNRNFPRYIWPDFLQYLCERTNKPKENKTEEKT